MALRHPVDFEDHCWRDVVSPEALEVYAPYRRETGIKGKPALLCVDLWTSVFPDGPGTLAEARAANPRSCGPYAWAAKPVLERLLDTMRSAGHQVVYSTQLPPDRNPSSARATLRRAAPGTGKPADDFRFHPDLAPAPADHIVRKARASAFFDTDLAEYLTDNDIETLVICGESTSGCVRATAVDAYSHGFHVVLVEDAVFDRHVLSHKISLFDLHHKYADVMSLSELEEHLSCV